MVQGLGTAHGIADDWGLALDSAGNIIVTGDYLGTIDLGGGTAEPPCTPSKGLTACTNLFVLKLTPSGQYVWARKIGGTGLNSAYRVLVNSNDDLIVTGYFTGTVDFGGPSLSAVGTFDGFVMKLASDGTTRWVNGFGSPSGGETNIEPLAFAPGGDVYVTAAYQGPLKIGNTTLSGPGISGADAMLARYSSAGAFLWAVEIGHQQVADAGINGNFNLVAGLAVDGAGNVVVSGDFNGEVIFGGTMERSPAGSITNYLAGYSPTGTFQWVQPVLNSAKSAADSPILFDGAGDLLAMSSLQSPATLVRYSAAGRQLAARTYPSTPPVALMNAAVLDRTGNLVIIGWTGGGRVDFVDGLPGPASAPDGGSDGIDFIADLVPP